MLMYHKARKSRDHIIKSERLSAMTSNGSCQNQIYILEYRNMKIDIPKCIFGFAVSYVRSLIY